MYKKVILIQIDSIVGYPPTLSLISELEKICDDLTVISSCVNEYLKSLMPKSVKLVKIGKDYSYHNNVITKMISLLIIRKKLWKYIEAIYDDDTIIWVMSNITVKHLGGKITNYNYNLHLFELVNKICYINDKFELDLKLKKLAHRAKNVIVCEYNRAHITQAWLRLDKLPLIISNKPMQTKIKKNSIVKHSELGHNYITALKGRTIVLYQGVVDEERPIEPFAKAVNELGEDFAFIVMSGSNCDHLKHYKNTFILPYISAPYHLEITSNAHIGILMYKPVYGQFTSPLNSLYCAPNKIYEYSQFGIPMLGNNIPGLKYTIEYNRMGICLSSINIHEIKSSIQMLMANYSEYSLNAVAFYKNDHKEVIIQKALKK